MPTKFEGQAQEVAYKLTEQQIAHALELAAAANYDQKVDPAFVGAVLVALATNTATASNALPSKR